MYHVIWFEGTNLIKRTKADANRDNLKKAVAARVANGRENKNCLGCGKQCSVTKAWIRKGWKYCSWECRTKKMLGSNAPNSGGGEWMKGVNNINYKHGKSAELGDRDWGAVKLWRRRVFERDKYQCQRCGYDKGGIIEAHHIATWAEYPDLRYNLSNGVTLCNTCHKWVHSKVNKEKELLKCN